MSEQLELWTLRPRPYAGEVLSSWLRRIACSTDLSLWRFLEQRLPRPSGDRFDIDQTTKASFFVQLASGTGVPIDVARGAGFASDDGRVFTRRAFNNFEWVVPYSAPDVFGRHHVVPFCPECLATDEDPFYRKAWRYAFSPICPHHGLLSTTCSTCGAPFGYVINGRTPGGLTQTHIGLCRQCGTPHRRTSDPSMHRYDDALLNDVADVQASLTAALEAGWHVHANGSAIAVAMYLRGLHDLAIHALNPRYGAVALKWVLNEYGMSAGTHELDGEGVNLEQRSPRDRVLLMLFASWLADEWPVRFIELVHVLRHRRYRPDLPSADAPFWMQEPGLGALKTSRRAYNENERAAASEMLRDLRGWPSTPTDLARFTSTGQTPPIKGKKRAAPAKSKRFFEVTDRRVEAMLIRRYSAMRAARTVSKDFYLPVPFHTGPQSIEDEFRESPEHAAIVQELRFTYRAETQTGEDDEW